ncbi:DUF58 domain-containing protein [Lacisediminihabitans changchengi]|uniref:DUF58 domain-containing protein n=1 Tax=Lacisediminihabitans changchengi TaxID=2787634 RepID=A0A934SQA4_9MICO|nr:DUF58 domain-containing protein [Lacisediminihabitans changchengi]MBK4346214.1 DUF58 domain-containing protein [Lacisediminihabitans changchengi]
MAARKTKRRIARPTVRGWVTGAAGVLGVTIAYGLQNRELLVLALLALALCLSAWIYVQFRPLAYRVDRTFTPPLIEAGGITTVELEIANLSNYRSPSAHWRDTWPWRPFVTVPLELGMLEARGIRHTSRGSAVRLGYALRPDRRGLFEVGPVIIDFADPFGLVAGAVVAEGTGELTVTPRIEELPEGAVTIAADDGATRMRQRRSWGGEDDLMTREYRDGDPMRRVHWRASAHHGELMVRQEEQRSHAEAHIVLETLRHGYRDARGLSTVDEVESESFEWAIEFCASLSVYLAERGFVVQVNETGARQLRDVEEIDGYLRSLAAIQLSARQAENFSLVPQSARAGRSQGSVFAILSATDTAIVDQLRHQRSSFDLAVAFLVDPWTSTLTEPLQNAGWVCVAVHPDDSAADAWLSLSSELEAARAQG